MSTSSKTMVHGVERGESTLKKRTKPFLFFFRLTYWEIVSTKTTGSEIHIETDHKVDKIFINGKELLVK